MRQGLNYVVGRFLKGAVESDIQGLMIGSNTMSGVEMTGLQESQQFSLLITEELTKADIFKLYIVRRYDVLDNYNVTPDTDLKGLLDLNAIQWLYPKEVRNYYTYSGRYCYSRIP
jgi:hypothetical protein